MAIFDWLAGFFATPPKETDEERDARDKSGAPIARPESVDPDWDVKIQRAREAWEAGRRLRKTQPVSQSTLFNP